jgi:hypothetical protein
MLSIQETTQIDSHTRQGSILATFLDLNIATSKKTYDATLDAVRNPTLTAIWTTSSTVTWGEILDATLKSVWDTIPDSPLNALKEIIQ